MYFVYILKSRRNSKYYIGSTNDIERRIKEHNKGKGGKFTSMHGPWILVYKNSFPTSKEARLEEKRIKSYKGGNAFKRLILAN